MKISCSLRQDSRLLHLQGGVRSDGTLMAVSRDAISNTGAYASTTMITMSKCTLIGAGPYKVPTTERIPWSSIRTSAGARRSAVSGCLSHIRHRGDDGHHRREARHGPLELRMKNLLKDGDRAATGQAMPLGRYQGLPRQSSGDERVEHRRIAPGRLTGPGSAGEGRPLALIKGAGDLATASPSAWFAPGTRWS